MADPVLPDHFFTEAELVEFIRRFDIESQKMFHITLVKENGQGS